MDWTHEEDVHMIPLSRSSAFCLFLRPAMRTGSGSIPRRYGPRNMPVPSWFQESTSVALQQLSLRPDDVVNCCRIVKL